MNAVAARIRAFMHWLDWWWDTRTCPHPAHRRWATSGDERMHYGALSRCQDCGKALRER